MKILIDSHVALWWLQDNSRLGPNCKVALMESEVFFSVVTPWELGIKKALGKIRYPDGLADALTSSGLRCLPITAPHAELAPSLEPLHKDPFDRMLIAQAEIERLSFATADRQIQEYGIPLVDAES